MKRKRLFCVGIMICVGLSLLAGCEEQKVDYGLDGNTESTQAGSAVSSVKAKVEQFAGAEKWEDVIQTTTSSNNEVEIEIRADISVPDTDRMYVVEVEECAFDEEYKKKIAKQIFGKETVYVHDYDHYTKHELEELQTFYQSQYDMYAGYVASGAGMGYTVEAYQSLLDKCAEVLETAKDTYTPAEDYTADEYLGYWDGVPYDLRFFEGDVRERYTIEESGWRHMREISLVPKGMAEFAPKELLEQDLNYEIDCYEGTQELYYYTDGGNLCQMPEEEAKKEAQRVVDELGFSDTVYTASYPLVWRYLTDQIGDVVDGYVFVYDFGVDDVSFADFGCEWQYWNFCTQKKSSDDINTSMEACIRIYVNDHGAFRVNIRNPLETKKVSSEVELLPLTAIQEIMKDELTKDIGQFRFSWPQTSAIGSRKAKLNDMQLIYFRVKDKENEGRYSYVPAWRLSNINVENIPYCGTTQFRTDWIITHGTELLTAYDDMWTHTYRQDDIWYYRAEKIQDPVLINAIDGSVINLYKEL